ncbi:MAG: hypothetical protein GY701_28915 [Sulfitobacter sp.]|nr:hypothetical protein [Sulfitobacter sp.]
MPEFRNRIVVFGEKLEVIDIRDDQGTDQPLVLFKNHSKPEDKPKVCTLQDWMEWDRNARNPEPSTKQETNHDRNREHE